MSVSVLPDGFPVLFLIGAGATWLVAGSLTHCDAPSCVRTTHTPQNHAVALSLLPNVIAAISQILGTPMLPLEMQEDAVDFLEQIRASQVWRRSKYVDLWDLCGG